MCGHNALGIKSVLRGSEGDPVRDKFRQRILVTVLQFAATATTEMLAGRFDVVRTAFHHHRAIHRIARCRPGNMMARRGDAIALGGDAQDQFISTHRKDS